MTTWFVPWLLAPAEIVVPLGAGLVLGKMYRRARGPLRALPALVAGLALSAAVLAAATDWRVGVWDGALLGILFALGSVGQAADLFRRRAQELLLACSATVCALGF